MMRETETSQTAVDMTGKGCKELREGVIETGLCAYCGACAGGCPYLVTYRGRIVVLDSCTIPEAQCYLYCPRTNTDLDSISRYTFGEIYPHNALGNVRRVLMARSSDTDIRKRAQYGGTVTALLSLALEQGLVDGAILTRTADDKLPEAFLAKSTEEVLQGSGSNFMAVPVLETLNRTPRDSRVRLAVVATPCQALSLRKMKKDPPQHGVEIENVTLVIGLFCTWALSVGRFHQFLRENCELSQVVKFDIPPPPANVFQVYTKTDSISFPLEQIREFIMPTCDLCLDMTAEFADISVGAAEGIEGWNTVLVRTPIGTELIEAATTKGVLETRGLPDENFAHLKAAALNKKRTALKNIVRKTGTRKNLLYLNGASHAIADRLLES